jgi:hypothetical protein
MKDLAKYNKKEERDDAYWLPVIIVLKLNVVMLPALAEAIKSI